MKRILKILIETNLFIALAAVAFMWANILFLHLDTSRLLFLSFQVFFSTWFVYQISRWVYYKKGEYANTEEWVVKWFEKHPKFNLATIIISGAGAFVFSVLLKWKTIGILLFIGGISVLYPFPVLRPFGIQTKLRDFPFIKIFLIAVVWSTASVLLPAVESGINLHERRDVFLLLLSQFVFIFFITLPFDINDAEVDRKTNIKTIASVLGIKASKIICLMSGILYAFLILYLFMIENWRSISNIYLKESTIYFIWLLLILLQAFTFLQSDKVKKWMIKLIYDGSMILYFVILFLTVK
ncbi:MAG: UbiA family prenyltransferase [Sphingobacteriales bacterium]|nr:UbiA family prenyltransferase [Sphingobacteriales bacterium]